MQLLDFWRGGSTGAYVLRATTATQVPLTVIGASGQTANLIEAKNFAGTVVFSVSNSGDVTYLGDEYVTDQLTVNGGATIAGTLGVTGATTLSTLITSGNTTVKGVLNVTGNSVFSSGVLIQNSLTVQGGFTTTGNIYAPNGTAAAPSITFAGDPDTGLYWTGSGQIGFTSNGTTGSTFGAGSTMNVNTVNSLQAVTLTLKGQIADGASAVGATIGSTNTLSTAGAKIASFVNNTTEKVYIDKDGNVMANKFYSVSGQFAAQNGGITAWLMGKQTDGATAVSTIIDANTALTIAGAKIVSIQNAEVEKAAIGLAGEVMAGAGTAALPSLSFLGDPNTGFYSVADGYVNYSSNGTVLVQFGVGDVSSNKFGSYANTFLQLYGRIADGASAIGVKIGNVTALTTAGAKIASFYSDNFTTEKASIDKDGSMTLGGYLYSTTHTSISGNSLTLKGQIADGASAVGIVLDNTVTLTTAGSKILSIKNNTVEKASIDKDGNFSGGSVFAGGGTGTFYGTLLMTNGPASVGVVGRIPDGGTAIGVKIANYNSLVTAGAKIASFYPDNGTTEKAYIDKDGLLGVIAGNKRTTIGANGGATALTALPVGYFSVNIAGTEYQVPYYNKGA